MIDKDSIYFYYVLAMCHAERITKTLPEAYGTKTKLIGAYENSYYFDKYPNTNTRDLINTLKGLFFCDEEIHISALCDDGRLLLRRCQDRIIALSNGEQIADAYTYDILCSTIIDYLWIRASVLMNKRERLRGRILLTDRDSVEFSGIKEYLCNLDTKISDAKDDLGKMKTACDLSLKDTIFWRSIEDKCVRDYANPGNYSHSELKERIADCEAFIFERETLLFAFAATSALRESMR